MTQEQKDLLFKDLCMRLPYGIKVEIKHHDDAWKLLAIYTNGTTYATRDIGYPIETYFEDCKPYLFPLSSMTEEQSKELEEIDPEFYSLICGNGDIYVSMDVRGYDWLNKNHFDYRGFIPMGLAIDATGLNIY